jgi:hypothetical protein
MTVDLRGRVVERGTGAGPAGLRVQAWGRATDAPAGEAETGDGGAFALTAAAPDDERVVGFTFQVYRGRELVSGREGDVVWSSDRPDDEVLIEVSAAGEVLAEVGGRLTGRGGVALPGLVVELLGTEADRTVPLAR